MLVEHVLDSTDVGLLESVLLPFDIYNDAADQSLRVLKQRFLYDEIEAEVKDMSNRECDCIRCFEFCIMFIWKGHISFELLQVPARIIVFEQISGFSSLQLDFTLAIS